MFAKKVEELVIYQIAARLRKEIYEEVHRIPNYWAIDDVRQIKRSSSSVPSNISEGWGRRFAPKDFVWFLNISIGSSEETKNHTRALYEANHFSKERRDYFQRNYKDLAIRITNFRNSIRKKHDLL